MKLAPNQAEWLVRKQSLMRTEDGDWTGQCPLCEHDDLHISESEARCYSCAVDLSDGEFKDGLKRILPQPVLPKSIKERVRQVVEWLLGERYGDGPPSEDTASEAAKRFAQAFTPEGERKDPAAAAWRAKTVDEGVAAALAATGQRPLKPSAEFAGDRMPEPVIWRDDRAMGGHQTGADGAMLARGDICALSGRGGDGKTNLALQLAAAAASIPSGSASLAGLGVAAGKTAVVSFEDRGVRIRKRLELFRDHADATGIDGVHIVEQRGVPIFGIEAGDHWNTRPKKLKAWGLLWEMIAEIEPVMVVIDPISAATAMEHNGVSSVREFTNALQEEAVKLDCGVLIIAHSTKGHRDNPLMEASGAIAGSAAWHDAARGLMTLTRKEDEETGAEGWLLAGVKANYGRTFKAHLAGERYDHYGDIVSFTETQKPDWWDPGGKKKSGGGGKGGVDGLRN